jgi:predicted dienelactone hydrolase
MPGMVRPRGVLGAERITLEAGPLQDSISVQSLKTFAETGKIEPDLNFYARFVGKSAMERLRASLQRRFRTNLVVVSRLSYSPLGVDALKQIGTLLRTDSRLNGFYAIRGAWLQSASNPNGFTAVDFLEAFPSRSIYVNVGELLQLQQLISSVTEYTDTTVKAIAEQAQREAASTSSNFSRLPNPLNPGPFKSNKTTFNLKRLTQTLEGAATERAYYVDLYLPEGKTTPAPLVIVSHGLGSTPAAFAYLGNHLASHGFAVAIPEHVGSGEEQFQALFAGLANSNVRLTEFVERPLDVKQVINELETRSKTDLAGKLDLSRIGVMGHSFGGYTALVSAGATLNLARVVFTCSAPDRLRLDLSFAFQCLNQALPPFDTRVLNDSRVKAAIAINPVTSIVLGPRGMETLKVPTMLIGGSQDILAPLIPEQVNPFFWLKTPDKYLTVIVPAGHTAADNTKGEPTTPLPNSFAEFLSGPDPALARQYIKALAVVFMQSYIGDQPEYRNYLNAGFARSLQKEPLQLNLVQSLTPQTLEQAYGGAPPIPFFPPALPEGLLTQQPALRNP